MIHQSFLLRDTVQLNAGDAVLILNSALDPLVQHAQLTIQGGTLTLAEDNMAAAEAVLSSSVKGLAVRHVAFHDYILHSPAGTMDVAALNLLYQPGNVWIQHALQVALYALRPGGRLYVTGAKDRGILSTAKRMQEYFGNVETLEISKGQRVVCSRRRDGAYLPAPTQDVTVFAGSKLDDGTRLLLDALEVYATDEALDIGSGAGFIGLHIAQRAKRGHVTLVDASLAAVDAARRAVEQSNLTNVLVLAGDGVQPVSQQRFDLVATNPPFHQGGIQTLEIAERFIRGAAHVLRPEGRFYIVANRFLKYEPTLHTSFKQVEEVGGDTRYKVLRCLLQ
ncbi:MAG TPA: methyltransferase [Ktedonobacteraceae bacterium]|nr:methyltransferase [Ktedonobacteraceae bacterium]